MLHNIEVHLQLGVKLVDLLIGWHHRLNFFLRGGIRYQALEHFFEWVFIVHLSVHSAGCGDELFWRKRVGKVLIRSLWVFPRFFLHLSKNFAFIFHLVIIVWGVGVFLGDFQEFFIYQHQLVEIYLFFWFLAVLAWSFVRRHRQDCLWVFACGIQYSF